MASLFLRSEATSRKDRHPISSPRFNPLIHTPGFSNLSAAQFRLETSRKARLAATLGQPQTDQGASKLDGTIGDSKIRGTAHKYSWRKTTGPSAIQDPGPIFDGATAGALRVHQYQGGTQVWVLDQVKAGTANQHHWTVPSQGAVHPTLPTYFLQVKEKKMPTWVTRGTINSYSSREKRALENSPAPTEDSLGDGGRRSARVLRMRLGAASAGLPAPEALYVAMFEIDGLLILQSADWVESPFEDELPLAQHEVLMPSGNPRLPPLRTTLVIPGATELADVGSLIRVGGDVRECSLTGCKDDAFLAIVSSPPRANVVTEVAEEVHIPTMSLGGPVKKVWLDTFGDVNLLVEAGKAVAPWKVRLSLHAFTPATQQIFMRLPNPCVISATVVYYRLQGRSIVFAPWSVDITYPDNPWLPFKPCVDPDPAVSFRTLDNLRGSSSQEDLPAVFMEPKVSRSHNGVGTL